MVMLQNLSEEVRLCYQRAEENARRAEAACSEAARAWFLRQEQSWIKLACSYELGRRLTLFSSELSKHNMVKGMGEQGHVGVDGSTIAGPAKDKLPQFGRTDDEPKRLENGQIAIVDDDEYARAGLRMLLDSLGRRAATFVSAEDFLASNNRSHTACLILDVHLPGMSGPELQAHLIADGRCPPTIFVTGRYEAHVQERVTRAGALGYLTKPCCVKDMLGCFEKVRRPMA